MIRLILATLVIANTAQADETWNSQTGRIVYLDERAGAAVFTFTTQAGHPATLVIPGLAGNFDNRSSHDAYWIGTGPGACPAALSGPELGPSADWGRARLAFDRPTFPTGFTLELGECFAPLDRNLRADLP